MTSVLSFKTRLNCLALVPILDDILNASYKLK